MTHAGMVFAALALAAGLITQGTKDAKGAKGAAALQGTWVVGSINGKPLGDSGTPELTLTFDSGKYHQTVGATVNERGTYKIDASKKPMAIDLAIAEGDDAGKAQLGIIEVSGDSMRAAFDRPSAGQRPTDFTVKEGVIVVAAKKRK